MKKQVSIIALILLIMTITSCTEKTLPIHEFTIKANNSADFIVLKSNGDVHAFSMKGESEKIGVLSDNGELKDNEGQLLAKIDKEGFVYNADSKKMVQIHDNGDIDNGSGKNLSWSNDGKFSMQQGDKFLQLNPNDKNTRKTASFLTFLMMSLNTETIDMSNIN